MIRQHRGAFVEDGWSKIFPPERDPSDLVRLRTLDRVVKDTLLSLGLVRPLNARPEKLEDPIPKKYTPNVGSDAPLGGTAGTDTTATDLSLSLRTVETLITNGALETLKNTLQTKYPTILEHPTVAFKLARHEFLEAIEQHKTTSELHSLLGELHFPLLHHDQ